MGTAYISSTPGILKLVTVVISIVVIGLAGYGHSNAETLSCGKNSCANKDFHTTWCKFGKDEEHKSICSWNWSPTFLIAVSVICLIISIASIIIYVLTEVQSIVKMADFIYHICGGILLIISGICVIVYGVKAMDVKCENLNLFGAKFFENACAEIQKSLYQPKVFIAAGVFAFINGCVFIVVGTMSRK